MPIDYTRRDFIHFISCNSDAKYLDVVFKQVGTRVMFMSHNS